MKKSIVKSLSAIFAAAILLPLTFTACSSDDDDDDVPENFVKFSGATVQLFGNEQNIASFYLAQTELTYEKWYEVYQWATSDERGENKYIFANYGREGSEGTAGSAPTENKNQPVTHISYRDAVVWCNAASEKDGLSPVYKYEGNVLREAENWAYTLDVYSGDNKANTTTADNGKGKAEKATIEESANGYRLPTDIEWEFAVRGGNPNSEEWSYDYAGTNEEESLSDYAVYNTDKTADVKSKKPNSAGLYDMTGNVAELCYSEIWAPKTYPIEGGSFKNTIEEISTNNYGRDSYSADIDFGFRLARSVN